MASLPLDDITVLDMSQVWAGPASAMLLADQGARVIKIEPLEGDHSRLVYKTPFLGESSRSFLALNRNKLGIAVNVADERGRQIIYDLAQRADVIIQSFRPGVAERLGIEYKTLHARNPRLIFASVTGFGEVGPYAHQPGYDFLLRALTSVLGENRYPDGQPIITTLNLADLSAAMLLAYGITLAIHVRGKTGEGQRVDTSLLASSIAMQAPQLVRVEQDDSAAQRTASPIFNCFRCGDGEYLAMHMPTDAAWVAVCQALGLEHLAQDPTLDTVRNRFEQKEAVFAVLQGVFETKPRADWLAILREYDIPNAPVLSREALFDEPQALQTQMITTAQHPRYGPLKMLGVPVRLGGATYAQQKPAPDLGEHTVQILSELGYDRATIEGLRQAKVIHCQGDG